MYHISFQQHYSLQLACMKEQPMDKWSENRIKASDPYTCWFTILLTGYNKKWNVITMGLSIYWWRDMRSNEGSCRIHIIIPPSFNISYNQCKWYTEYILCIHTTRKQTVRHLRWSMNSSSPMEYSASQTTTMNRARDKIEYTCSKTITGTLWQDAQSTTRCNPHTKFRILQWE